MSKPMKQIHVSDLTDHQSVLIESNYSMHYVPIIALHSILFHIWSEHTKYSTSI